MYSKTVDIVMHTDDAYHLFMGGAITKENQFIPSFYYTKREMDKLLPMAYKGNPFAVTGLKTLELTIKHIEHVAQQEMKRSQELLDIKKQQGMSFRLIGKEEPYQEEINMVNQFTQLTIAMMINCDQCFRYVRTANLATDGEFETEAVKKIRELRNKVRHLFGQAVIFGRKIQPGITIKDVVEKSERSKPMIEKFGIPHEKVLSGEISYKSHNINILGYD